MVVLIFIFYLKGDAYDNTGNYQTALQIYEELYGLRIMRFTVLEKENNHNWTCSLLDLRNNIKNKGNIYSDQKVLFGE